MMRRYLERIEAVPIAGVAGRRSLIAQEIRPDPGRRFVEVEGEIGEHRLAGRVEIVAGIEDVEGAHVRLATRIHPNHGSPLLQRLRRAGLDLGVGPLEEIRLELRAEAGLRR